MRPSFAGGCSVPPLTSPHNPPPPFVRRQMLSPINSLRRQAPEVVATIEDPALALRRQEVASQLARRRPPRSIKNIEIHALPHLPSSFPQEPSRIILERIPLTFEHSPRGERSFCILVG